MTKEISIEEIINFLEKQNLKFDFKGNKKDKIDGFSTLFNYRENTLTFVSSLNRFSDYSNLFEEQKLQLVIVDSSENTYNCFKNVIKIEKPKMTFFTILDYFFSSENNNTLISTEKEFYENNSYVSSQAIIGNNVKIGVGCVIEEGVVIGNDTVIHHNVVVRRNVTIGSNCSILSGTIIGETGFNPLKADENKRNMIKHYGGVVIKDDVHIGDSCNISRGTIEDTIINKGVKLNKQVILAHNVVVGENTVFTSPVFVGGSVFIGNNCHVAASVIRNQCTIGNNAVLGLGAVVIKDVEAGQTVIGNPAKPMKR
ncbi:UDP-3-O-(3-hydroxymyristoyl)glucosamine N-acyltransferase [Gracilibacillus timonensis]|uniref:UDP-3-O-(3-hydroxymyristoyl)glucosamine N-acyltransferase n=1 Tax=Gracilibacillus timonensis TaxID=1816696 RepID=UPI000824A6F2|nr:UDP-3-O-(3-hydroxymyristoyl)glucosamine N-acyltransferase [Gracilibacillus timonensis]